VDQPRTTILIVEDDLDIADLLKQYLQAQGYHVLTANWGEDGLRACSTNPPDLVILDIRLPDIDGFEVARRLRTNHRTKDTPIIFLTEKRERMDRLKGLELHAEDYITKPFDIQELRLRIRNVLERSHRSSLINAVTELPEGDWVDDCLTESIQTTDSALLFIKIRNVDFFRESYGFVAADDLLRAIGRILQDALRDQGNETDFLGHISPNDFVILTRINNLSVMKETLAHRLDQSFDFFYRDHDRQSPDFQTRRIKVSLYEIDPPHSGAADAQTLKKAMEAVARQKNS
jgi:DNA-binding response OmpR family regulator